MSPASVVEALQARYPGAETFRFGDSAELSAELLELIRTGRKRATVTALRDVEAGREAMPELGRQDIALDWDGRPALVIETVEVRVQRFDEVDEAFALDEGEDDSLAGWRASHREYFERNGGFDPAMMLICERFRVVETIGEAAMPVEALR
ncbi:MAG: ASCH domain-containing protein [Pikeienuella sp.]